VTQAMRLPIRRAAASVFQTATSKNNFQKLQPLLEQTDNYFTIAPSHTRNSCQTSPAHEARTNLRFQQEISIQAKWIEEGTVNERAEGL
jgi:hypothetical protein